MNNGKCLDTYKDENGNRIYLCLCTDGWGGKNCDIQKNQLDWSVWTDWGKCSVSCGNGYQTKSRICIDTVTNKQRPITDCYGADIEYRMCPYKECPRWESWGTWGECSTQKTCGVGTVYRSRNCTNGGTVGVDRYCLGPASETSVCHSLQCKGMVRLRNGTSFGEGRVEMYNDITKEWLQVCSDHWDLASAQIFCKQRGYIGAYAAFTDNTYIKVANSTQPSISVRCNGTEKTLQACVRNTTNACQTPAGAQCRVRGVWSLWAPWGVCSVTCEDGIQTRKRECNHPPPNHGGQPCPGNDTDHKACRMIMCPVDGSWTVWSPWSDCSVTCENGTQYRTRTCNLPQYGGSFCPGNDREVRGCFPKMCPVNGSWKPWESWSDCSATCGYGSRNRSRTCIEPLYGGAPCSGVKSEVDACNSFSCPIDGSWKPWEAWGNCSTTCGGGQRNRTRVCNQAQFGGGDCIGETMQSQICNTHNCPVDGVWAKWSNWTECSVSCAVGTQSRNRTCIGPYFGGNNCTGDQYEEQKCMVKECPVDGSWKLWSLWDECNVTCGGGIQQRYRTCVQPQFGGLPCNGSDIESKDCNTHFCPVNGTWHEWSNWTDCTTTCGGGLQTRHRICEEPKYGGLYCDGPATETRNCSTDPCPLDGYWKTWSMWSICDLTCGGGSQQRNRTCVEPLHGGHVCDGNHTEIQACNTQECPVDGSWNSWTDWSDCSLTCGSGSQFRNRTCNNPAFGGTSCIGADMQQQLCNTQNCPVDGYWTEWSDWGECSLSCGDGEEFRYRTCVEPQFGGKPCEGPPIESQYCNPASCPVDGIWMMWSSWTKCDLTCGGGTRSRNRTCNGPSFGGVPCNGTYNETEPCSEQPCPVDGVWMMWSSWTNCDKACGMGTRSRNRTCNGPYFGGLPCNGSYYEKDPCSNQPCPGIWSMWSFWDDCTVTCGGGLSQRYRICTSLIEKGEQCDGDNMEQIACNDQICPVDGVFLPWTEWGTCSKPCGVGERWRTRSCDGPYGGGKNCTGNFKEMQLCNTQNCSVDGIFEEWSLWSSCPVSCGGGQSERSRKCFGPMFGGKPCEGDFNQTKDCNIFPCPVDGVWKDWGNWSKCDVTCGGGLQSRSRECQGPFYNGAPCLGNNTEHQSCNNQECPIAGVFSEWSNWDACNVSCGGGQHWRNRTCYGPYYGGAPCIGDFKESQTCNEMYCPVDGYWNPWSGWGDCDVSCGGGTQHRNRKCVEPLYGGANCTGSNRDTQNCNTQHCPVDGYYKEWAPWGDCTALCGGGTKSRNRTCVQPMYGGALCVGPGEEVDSCNTQHCPVNGLWKSWSNWTDCTVTCGGGTSSRNRTCDGPYYGGSDCVGNKTEDRVCNTNPCPINGKWFDWTSWSTCTVTCEGGLRSRTRKCDMNSYGNLTAPCSGNATETEACHTFPCTPEEPHCYGWRKKGLVDSVFAWVAPVTIDGYQLNPVEVFCDMKSNGGTGVTVIGHNAEAETRVSGYEGSGDYALILTYNISIAHAGAIIDASANCSQFLQWKCKGATIHTPNQEGKWTTFWTNRSTTYIPQNQYKPPAGYFPGAEPGSGYCGCGQHKNCDEPGFVCNCDINDEVWRSDGGYITNKPELPVVAFYAGDTGAEGVEEGRINIGKVYCEGVSH